ncbi:MAG: hypothetical protein J7J19_03595 [Thaumarchaeota archaeon]|nr:hypothetical protein [Nitrososphaerota archaeon]
MLVKFGVGGLDLSSLHVAMWYAVKVVNEVWQGEEPVITSTWEGTHVPWSMHYRKRALDFRVPKRPIKEVISELKEKLGKDYDVLYEGDHIHIEYDPKR